MSLAPPSSPSTWPLPCRPKRSTAAAPSRQGLPHHRGWPIHNHDKKAHGRIDLAKVLQVSSNVGMVRAMQRMDSAATGNGSQLELNSAPDTDLPGAVHGQLKSLDTFTANAIEPATASFGQGLALTPLKLLQLRGCSPMAVAW